MAEKAVSSAVSGVPQALRLGILMYLWHLERHVFQMCLSPCGYIINSAKEYPGLKAIPALTPFQMWRALGSAILVKKESMKQKIHLSNAHVVVCSRWELGRKAIVEERNSYKLPCVTLLSGSCQGTSYQERTAWKRRITGSEIYTLLTEKIKKTKPQTSFHIDLGEFEIQAALGAVCFP